MSRFSTKLRQDLLGSSDFKSVMDGGFIHIYGFGSANTVPTNPDNEIDTTGGAYVLLATISASGGTDVTGLNFAAPANGFVVKDPGQTWDNSTVENFANGTPQFYLHVGSTESDGTDIAESTILPRILGGIGFGQPMQLQEETLVADQTTAISFYRQSIGD